MKSFETTAIQNGRLNQQKATETPNTFGEAGGSAQVTPTGDLSKSNKRMAGEQGARALAMMTDPVEQQRTGDWMQAFGTSNQGMQWNAAKMGLPPKA